MADDGESRSSFDDLKLYQYDDFPEGQAGKYVRLLSLLPKAESDAMIRCKLSQHILLDDDCPTFEALSYVWGPPIDHKLVLVDDQAILVTPNLYSALWSLRRDTPRYLWVDQICIQQDAALEKNSQIPLMRDIYSRASQTIAWLGPNSENMDTAFQALTGMSRAWSHYISTVLERAQNGESSDDENTKPQKTIEEEWGCEPPTKSEINAVKLMLYNPWFTRVWIIQEATISSNVVMFSGSSSIGFDQVLAGILTMHGFLAQTRRNDIVVEGNKMLGILARIRNKLQKSDQGIGIVQLIADCHLFKATDDRDRFFALYGISTIAKELPSVQADYTLPPTQALSQAMVDLMRHEGSLRLLELSDSSTESDLPSWAPRARTAIDPQRLPTSTLHNNDEFAIDAFCSSIKRLYGEEIEEQCPGFSWEGFERGMSSVHESISEIQAARHDLPQARRFGNIELLSDLTLVVQGQLVDRIGEISPVVLNPGGIESGYGSFPQESRYLQDIENLSLDEDEGWMKLAGKVASEMSIIGKFAGRTMSQWRANIDAMTKMDLMVMSKAKTAQYGSKDAILQAYRTVVTGGQTEDDYTAKTYDMGEKEIMKTFQEWRKNISTSVSIDSAKRRFGLKGSVGIVSMLSTSVRAHAGFRVESRVMLSHFMAPLYGRRMAWTAGGRLALVPALTQESDHILYLQGSEMPFVMRLQGTSWRMIGPAYIDGLMEGQLYDADCLASIKIR